MQRLRGTQLALLFACACSSGLSIKDSVRESGDTDTSAGSAGDSSEPVVDSAPTAPDPSDAVFDPTVVHELILAMDSEAWADVRDNPSAKNWHAANFAFDADPELRVAVRAFGAGSLVAGKPSLKIDFNREVPGQRWRGLDELKLDNSSQDRGYLNEFTASTIYREIGIPASRSGWTELVVNGQGAGFFVLLESIDDELVKRWFGDSEGHLYSTNEHYWGQGLNPISGDPSLWFASQTSTGGDATDVAALAELVASGTDEELLAVLDLEGFFRESVTRSVLGSLDSFLADGNNYYLYHHHGNWKLIPWDFDADLGYPWYFEQALMVDPQQPWLSSPWAYNCVSGVPYTDPVLLRALAMGMEPENVIRELMEGPLAWEPLAARIEAAEELIRPHVEADVLGSGPYFQTRQADLRLFLHARLSGLAGRAWAPCPKAKAQELRAADLAPTGTVGWGSLAVDSTNWGPGLVINGDAFCSGIFAHSPSRVELTIPKGYGQFSGAVGLQDWNRNVVCDTGAYFSIQQEDVTLWTSGLIRGYTDAQPFGPIEVQEGQLVLIVDPNGDYSCDTSAWVDLSLVPSR